MSTASAGLTDLLKYCGITTGKLTEKEEKEFADENSRYDFMEKCLINDAIYGPIELTRLLYLIINTPEFDRLRHIKQLGAANYVYPGANHTRLDHSIGVCYLAGEFAKSLKEKIEKDKKNVESVEEKMLWTFTNEEIICVQVAGLCHDLGHGPFSHMFETMVVKDIYEGGVKFEHEDMSVAIFKRLLVKNPKVLAQFTKAKLGLEEVQLIEKMIQPPKQDTPVVDLRSGCDTEQRAFLYEIVANKKTGIDVDKWDYYARDCHYLGVTNDFQWKRCMKLGRVVKSRDGKLRIAFRDKEMDNLYGMFRIRGSLHQKAYQHKTSKAVEKMISDAMILAGKNPQFDIVGVSNSEVPMTIQTAVSNAAKCVGPRAGAVNNAELLEGYIALTDCILSTIKGRAFITKSTDISRIIERIEKRDLYHLSAKIRIPKEDSEHLPNKDQKEPTSEKLFPKEDSEHLPSKDQKEPTSKKLFPWENVEELRTNAIKLEELRTKVCELFNTSPNNESKPRSQSIKSTDLWIQIVRFKVASEKKDNPVKDVLFYKKPNGKEPIEVLSDDHVQHRLTSMLARPKALVEYEVRVYDKREGYIRESGDSDALQDALDKCKETIGL